MSSCSHVQQFGGHAQPAAAAFPRQHVIVEGCAVVLLSRRPSRAHRAFTSSRLSRSPAHTHTHHPLDHTRAQLQARRPTCTCSSQLCAGPESPSNLLTLFNASPGMCCCPAWSKASVLLGLVS